MAQRVLSSTPTHLTSSTSAVTSNLYSTHSQGTSSVNQGESLNADEINDFSWDLLRPLYLHPDYLPPSITSAKLQDDVCLFDRIRAVELLRLTLGIIGAVVRRAVDFDVGLRNLDLVMGAERRVVFDFINVAQGDANVTLSGTGWAYYRPKDISEVRCAGRLYPRDGTPAGREKENESGRFFKGL